MQLMQQKVQKSSRTILPLRSLRRSGPAVFSQAVPPLSSGAATFWRARSRTGLGGEACGSAPTTRATAARASHAKTTTPTHLSALRRSGGTKGCAIDGLLRDQEEPPGIGARSVRCLALILGDSAGAAPGEAGERGAS